MKNTKSPVAKFFVLSLGLSIATLSPLGSQSALAADATWNSSPNNGIWEAAGAENNWSTGAATFPGATGTLNNAETATFLTSGSTTISVNSTAGNASGLNIKNITFGSGVVTSPNSFTVGSTSGNALLLSSGGTVSISSSVVAGANATETINAPIVLEPATTTTAGAYTFSNSAASSNNTLVFGGTITGGTTTGAGAAGVITLTLTGANAGANAINGIISNGGATGGVAVSKTSSGTWTLSGANTYTGTTAVNAGTLSLTGSLSSATLSMGGGTFSYDKTGTNTQSFTTTNIASGVSAIKNTVSTDTLALGALAQSNNATVFLTKTGNISTSNTTAQDRVVGDNNLGGWIVIDNGNNTYDWANSGTSGVNNIAAVSYQAGGTGNAGNVRYLSGTTSFNTNGSWVSINLQGASTVLNTNVTQVFLDTGGIILSGGATWGGTGSGKTNIGAFYIHTPDSGTISKALVNNGATAASLYKDGPGTLTLSGANSYTGATTVTSGTLSVSSLANGASNSNIGASANTADKLILNGGTLKYTGAAVSTDRLFSLQSSSTIDASGSGAVNFTNTGSMGFNSGTAAKTLTLTGTSTGANTLAAVIGDNTGATSVTKSGAGTWVLSGTNTYTGGTTVSAGTLTLSNALALQNSALDTTNSIAGTSTAGLQTTVTSLTMGGLTGNKDLASVFTTTSGGYSTVTALTLNPGTAVTNAYSGVIADGAAGMTLTKTGLGTQTLSGTNTYTGATTVKAGTLIVSGSLSASSAVTVGDTAAPTTGAILGGSGSVGNVTAGAVASSTGASVDPGNSSGVAGILKTGSLTVANGAHLSMQIGGTTAGGEVTTGYDQIVASSTVTLIGGDLNLTLNGTPAFSSNDVLYLIVNNSGGSAPAAFGTVTLNGSNVSDPSNIVLNGQQFQLVYNANFSGTGSDNLANDVALMAVPEPSTWAMLVGGVGMLGAWQRNRRRA